MVVSRYVVGVTVRDLCGITHRGVPHPPGFRRECEAQEHVKRLRILAVRHLQQRRDTVQRHIPANSEGESADSGHVPDNTRGECLNRIHKLAGVRPMDLLRKK
jgi:hypothetical protein